MATMVLQYCVLVFLLGLTATYAGYCGKNCCLQKGIGKDSCDASGTSDVSDLFGKMYGGKKTICVAGRQGDVYRIWNVYVQWQQGIQTLVFFSGLYGYLFQIPKTASLNCKEFRYLILELGVCTELKDITYTSDGNVAGTNFPYKTLVQIAKRNTEPSCNSAPCQILQASSYESCTADIDVGLSTQTVEGFSSVTAGQYLISNGSSFTYSTEYPSLIAKKEGFSVTFDARNGMFYQPGYRYGKQYTCKDPNPYSAGGYCLTEFYSAAVNTPSAVCYFTEIFGECQARLPLPQLYFDILFFLIDPYDAATVFYALNSANLLFPTFRALFSAGC